MTARPPVIVVSGKNPLHAPGGYASYGRNLCGVLHGLGHRVHVVALGDRDDCVDTPLDRLHVVGQSVAARVAQREMAALPVLSVHFARRIERIARAEGARKIMVWGLGPWGVAGALIKHANVVPTTLLVSYFTTFLHEMRGSLQGLRVADYGVSLKLQYAAVVHGLGPGFHRLERFLVAHADRVVTHYRSTELILQDELGVPPERFRRLSYCIDETGAPPPRRARAARSGPWRAVTVCRQDPRKGINFLLHAMALLRERGVDAACTVVGGGSMLEANRRLARRLRVDGAVTFTGRVDDVRPYLDSADAFVFPAIEEGSGSLAVLEAMSVGLPLIASRVDGLPEDVVDGVSGLLVPAMDAAALAAGIQRLHADDELAQALGRGARAVYRKRFNLESMRRGVARVLAAEEP